MYSILNRIREIIDFYGLSDSSFAKSLDIPQATFSNMFQRQSEPKPSWLQGIIDNYKVNANWLLTGEGEMFNSSEPALPAAETRIPIISQKVSCGPGKTWESEQNIVEYLDVKTLSPKFNTKNIYGFRVSGTSMLGAGIKDGDIVLFNADNAQILNDGIYVFSLDGDAYCKRLEFDKIANRIKIYSVRVADLEKAELLKTLSSTDEGFEERFQLFGQVISWIHIVTPSN